MTDEDLIAEARDVRRARVQLAREDVNTFIELVARDERTGEPVEQAPMHEAWHYLADEHDRTLFWAHVESGKTSQLSVFRTLFRLGQDPNRRIAIVSNTHGQASKIVRAIAHYLEHDPAYREVFPEVLPDKKTGPWTQTALKVQRNSAAKDPSVQAFGVHGNILGARIDDLILDDVLDYENCRTPAARQDLWDWYHATLAGRLTDGARVIVVGTAFHPDDFLHQLARTPGWKAYRYPVLGAEGKPRWPERWPTARVEQKRLELGPVEFARQMLCQARDDATARFKQEWLDVALARGSEMRPLPILQHLPPGCRTYTGVDLAVQRHAAADLTAFVTILVHPNGDRQVLSVESGRWAGPDILNRIIDVHQRYQSIVIVENNAAQDFMHQFVRKVSSVPIYPFTTGRNKTDPAFGVESLAAEMAGGKWIIPSKPGANGERDAEIDSWLREMLYYNPTAHTGDRLMASWFAREGARKGERKARIEHLDLLAR